MAHDRDRRADGATRSGAQASEHTADTTRKEAVRSDFIRDMIRRDLAQGEYDGVVTRFPPEPNGYLHIGHAKSIVLNFGVAEEFEGRCHLRFDDTNPETEEEEYERSIIRDVRWLGFDWGEHLYYASDYFEPLYGFAVELISKGLAYVDSQSEEQIRETRGTVTEPGRDSPYRERSVEENLDLLARMKAGEFENGAHVLRAKIDMSAANMKMRDPLLYRIRNVSHYRAGAAWHIYPMYDFAHCLEDAIERITHSLCTLEFENNRDIYDWVLENVSIERPRPFQTEFARLALTYTVMSKRKLLALVKGGRVAGWDDPRMPTLAGMRRRGYTPEAIRAFCEDVGVAKANATVEIERLEHAVRDDLNTKAPRMMAVLDPLKLVVESWPEGEVEWLDADLWPRDVPKEGSRKVPFGRELYIEREDFMEEPVKGFRRLYPGSVVRLRHGYVVRCTDVVKGADGEILEVRAVHDPGSTGTGGGEMKAKGAIHWVSAEEGIDVPVRVYGRLFSEPFPDAVADKAYEDLLDPASLREVTAKGEPELSGLAPGAHVQLERQGFFFADPVDGREGRLVLNRTVALRDTWAKVSARDNSSGAEAAAAKKVGARAAAKGARQPAASEDAGAARAARPLDAGAIELRNRHGISDEQARLIASRSDLRAFFEAALTHYDAPAGLARWVTNEVAAITKDRSLESLAFGPEALAQLVRLVDGNEITAPAGKTVLDEMVRSNGSPAEIVERLGLRATMDEASLGAAVERIIAAHPEEAARYREGKRALIGFFIGKVMEATGGKVAPGKARAAVELGLASAE